MSSEKLNEVVLLDRQDDVAVLTLNVPDRRNAYSMEMRKELLTKLSALMEDDPCGAIVLTGAGGNFCAGGDIGQMKRRNLIMKRQHMAYSQQIVGLMVNGPKAVIAAVEGYAYGVGLSLVAASNYVVADPGAKFCSAFIRMGVMPDGGLLWTLPRKVTPSKAEELMLLGTDFGAGDAQRWGLVNAIAEPGKALATAVSMAKQFAVKPPIAIAMIKAALGSGSTTLERAFQSETSGQPVLTQTADNQEAVAAFKEKRKPLFKGE